MSMPLPVHPRRLFVGLTLCLGLTAPLLFPVSTLALASWPVGANSATIGAGGGTVGIVGSVVTVVIPANALDTPRVVTLAALPTSPLPDPVPSGLVLTGQPVTVGLPVLVAGATAQLTLPVDSSAIPAGYQLAVLRSGVWTPLPTTMTDSSDVVATITTGGTYAPFALTASLLSSSPGASPTASATPVLTPAPSPSRAVVVAPASPKATPRAPATSLPLEPAKSTSPGVGIYIALLGLMALILLMEFRGLRAGRSTVFRRRYR